MAKDLFLFSPFTSSMKSWYFFMGWPILSEHKDGGTIILGSNLLVPPVNSPDMSLTDTQDSVLGLEQLNRTAI